MKINITVEIDDEEIKKLFGKTEPNEKTIKDSTSQYARFFDDGCVGWSKDSEQNLMFLKTQQTYANDMLRSRGHLFLNDVYDLLGIPHSKAGQVVGWIYGETFGDSFVDFGINEPCNQNAVNGLENVFLLDFNVDGNILDRI